MKVLSLWQPYASLAIWGNKRIETRSWEAPDWIIGERLGIASTKQIKSEQRELFDHPDFQKHYQRTKLPTLDDLPHGYLLGVVRVESCKRMTPADMKRVSDRELFFGDWWPGRYAWRLRVIKVYGEPIPVKGGQKIWNYNESFEATGGADQTRAA